MWTLSQDSFSFLDRLKVSAFILNRDNNLTMGEKTLEFEKKMAAFAGVEFALATSSGSTANHIIFETFKQKKGYNIDNYIVLVPSTTWISSITPITMAGFKIEFIDINLEDFCFDYKKLDERCSFLNTLGKNIIIWPTALIGFVPDFKQLRHITIKYGAELFLDSCENTLSKTLEKNSVLGEVDMTSTSCYFSHQITALEMGFVFFKSEKDYEQALMIRSHGMTRNLPQGHQTRTFYENQNKDIDPQFLFAVDGTNYRPTDLNAKFGLLDFERKEEYYHHRRKIYKYFHELLDSYKYYLPKLYDNNQLYSVPFCLPIFVKQKNKIEQIKKELNLFGIQTRPIISGNIVRQPVFKNKSYIVNLNPPDYYSNSEWLHSHGCYVGLHQGITKKSIEKLIQILEKI